jgi:hypothetical protein
MSKKQKVFELRVIAILTLITNLFIIAGVTRHWNYGNNTKLAETQQEAAQVQKETKNDTGCQSPYQIFN